jgi:hypothetical protein
MNRIKEICCCGDAFFVEQLIKRLEHIEEQEIKDYMKIRYLRVVNNLEKSSKISSFWYYTLTGIITVGTILTSSLITVQDRSKNDNAIYWSVWSISLSVTLSNAILKMLGLDKSHISRNIKLNQFKSEGSLYLSKTGIYDINNNDERFKLFVANIEKLKREMILDEYLQNEDQRNDATERRRSTLRRSPRLSRSPVSLHEIRIIDSDDNRTQATEV